MPAGAAHVVCQHRSVNDPAGVLPNPIWHALGGEQAVVADTVGRARRFRVDVSPFSGLPDRPVVDDWDALRTLVGPGETALLLRNEIVAPEHWETAFTLEGVQMVFDAGAPSSAPRADPAHFPITTLGFDDVPDMLELVGRTEPGPFTPNTIELGTYFGVHVDGALIAMAGERMRPPGYTEVERGVHGPHVSWPGTRRVPRRRGDRAHHGAG